MRTRRHILRWVFLIVLAVPAVSSACPVCFGDAESAEVEGMKWAILFLVVLTGIVLSSIVAFAVYLRRRSKVLATDGLQVPRSY